MVLLKAILSQIFKFTKWEILAIFSHKVCSGCQWMEGCGFISATINADSFLNIHTKTNSGGHSFPKSKIIAKAR